jgi:hypothetical protein
MKLIRFTLFSLLFQIINYIALAFNLEFKNMAIILVTFLFILSFIIIIKGPPLNLKGILRKKPPF